MFDALITTFLVLVALTMIVYATWMLIRSLRAGEPKRRSFKEWAKSVWEAVWGL